MMSQMAQDCRLPDSALSTHLDGKTCVECGERHGEIWLTIEKAPNRPRLSEDRGRTRPKVRRLGAQSFTNHGAARVADLQDVTSYRYLRDDQTNSPIIRRRQRHILCSEQSSSCSSFPHLCPRRTSRSCGWKKWPPGSRAAKGRCGRAKGFSSSATTVRIESTNTFQEKRQKSTGKDRTGPTATRWIGRDACTRASTRRGG